MQNKENFSAILFQDVILLALAINDDGIYDSEKYTVSCSDALDSGLAFSQNFRNIAVGTLTVLCITKKMNTPEKISQQ